QPPLCLAALFGRSALWIYAQIRRMKTAVNGPTPELTCKIPTGLALSCRHVVDQPRLAEPGGDQQPGRASAAARQRLERIGVAQAGIVDRGEARRDQVLLQRRQRPADL